MEASEAIRRIFWRHRWLLLVLVLAPVAVVVPLREHQPVVFAATAQVQGQDAAPDSSTQVTAIQSRITAAATSTALVQQAITAAGVTRNPVQVARHQVTVTPLGSSAVMLITVTDADPSAAISMAGALARAVVTNLNQLGTRYNPQLTALDQNTAKLTAQRNHLVRQLDAAHLSANSVKVQSLLAQLNSVEQQLSNNLASVQQVLAGLGSSTGVQLMSTPTFVTGVSRHVAAYGALAALLGLVLGLIFAIIREVIRPTIAEPGAGARELGVVLLGNAEARNDQLVGLDAGLAGHLALAAQQLGVQTAVLTGPVSRGRLSALARAISSEFPADQRHGAGGSRSWADTPTMPFLTGSGAVDYDRRDQRAAAAQLPTIVALPDINLSEHPGAAALVVVLPRYAPHYALDRITDLGASTKWPVLGVIGLRRSRRFRRRRSGQPAALREAAPVNAAGAIPAAHDGMSPAQDNNSPAQDDTSPAQHAASFAVSDSADQRGARA